MNIVAVKPHPKKEGQGFVLFDDPDATEAWTPEFEKAKDLVGKPVPEGWDLKNGPYGKQLLPPRDRKAPQTAWRNTREGAEFEAANWRRKQAIDQERSDRRTALMQAAVCRPDEVGILQLADQFYGWLRLTATVSGEPKETLAHGEGTSVSTAPDGAEMSADVSAPPRSEAGDTHDQAVSNGEVAPSDAGSGSSGTASDIVPFGPFSGKTFTEWAQANPGTLRSVLRAGSLNGQQKEKAEKALQAVGA